ncbi:MAG: LapA family protein [Syntrophomonadaceae bacterium]|jgi:uncharacterized integral membrane protein
MFAQRKKYMLKEMKKQRNGVGKMQVYLIGAILFLAVMVTFVFQNPTAVEIHFITWSSPQVSLALVVLVTALGGALITFLLDSVRYFKIARTIKELRNNNSTLQKQIQELQAHKDRLEKEAADRIET